MTVKICAVCGEQYKEELSNCPRCGFEHVDLYVGGYIGKSAADYRAELLDQLEIGVELYSHHANGDYIEPDPDTKRISFGKCSEFRRNSVMWSDVPIVRETTPKVNVTVSIFKDGVKMYEKHVMINTLPQTELVYLGIEIIPETFHFRLHMKNSAAECVSDPVSLLKC